MTAFIVEDLALEKLNFLSLSAVSEENVYREAYNEQNSCISICKICKSKIENIEALARTISFSSNILRKLDCCSVTKWKLAVHLSI